MPQGMLFCELWSLILVHLLYRVPYMRSSVLRTCKAWWYTCKAIKEVEQMDVAHHIARDGHLSLMKERFPLSFYDWLGAIEGATAADKMDVFECLLGGGGVQAMHWPMLMRAMDFAAKYGRLSMLRKAESGLLVALTTHGIHQSVQSFRFDALAFYRSICRSSVFYIEKEVFSKVCHDSFIIMPR
jgi:hypothetical protein